LVAEYVENINPSKWVVGAWNETSYLEFGSTTPIQCHGWRTNNLLESMNSEYLSNIIQISDPLTALRLWMARFVANLLDKRISASIWDGACKRLVPFAKSTLEFEITKSVENAFVSGFLSYDINIPITSYVKRSIQTCVARNETLYCNTNI
jgi:hypothetical protein